MNIMNFMNQFSPCWAAAEKKNVFSLFSSVQKAVLCSYLYMMFINSVMRIVRTGIWPDFMNIMQIYVQGLYKGAFGKCLFFNEHARRANFMNVHKRSDDER